MPATTHLWYGIPKSASGEPLRVLRTTDGGLQWTEVFRGTTLPDSLTDVHILDYAVRDRYDTPHSMACVYTEKGLVVTRDQGDSWTFVQLQFSTRLYDIRVWSDGRIWWRDSRRLPDGGWSSYLNCARFVWGAGSIIEADTLLALSEPRDVSVLGEGLVGYHVIPESGGRELYAAGYSRTLLDSMHLDWTQWIRVSTNEGRSWTESVPQGDCPKIGYRMTGFHMFDPVTGFDIGGPWCTSYGGSHYAGERYVYASVDGWQTWGILGASYLPMSFKGDYITTCGRNAWVSNGYTILHLRPGTLASSDMPQAPSTLDLAVPSPHPLRNGMPAMLRITSRSAHSENCDITLRDLLGREVARMYRGDLGHEERTITWTPNGLASGVYLMQLRGAGEVRTRTIIIE